MNESIRKSMKKTYQNGDIKYDNVEELKTFIKALESYPLQINGKEERPIIILGPEGSSKNKLRVYAYGGDVGKIPINKLGRDYKLPKTKNAKNGKKEKGYAKYIRSGEGYKNEHGQTFKVPDWLISNSAVKQALKYKSINDEEELLKSCIDENNQVKIKEYLKADENNYYLPLILAAQYNRWTKYDGEITERRIQCEIVKKYQKECGSIKGRDFIVTDIEYKFPLTKERSDEKRKKKGDNISNLKGMSSKPDFIVFDGESFGLVELKYNGEGYSDNNDLDVHFLDFYDLLRTVEDKEKWKKQWAAYGECLRRLKILLDLDVLVENKEERKKWLKKYGNQQKYYEENKDEKFDHSLFWCGFYFIGGKETANNKIKSCLWRNKDINKKLNEIKVYAGYCDKYERDFNLDKLIVAQKETEEEKDLFN